MKKLLITFSFCLDASSALFAQTLNVTGPGYSGVKLFDSAPGTAITGMGADFAGDIYYLESSPSDTLLYKRTPVDGYAVPSPVYDYGSPVYGSFVVAHGGKIYFGESLTGSIRSIDPDGTGEQTIGTVVNNYGIVFSGGNAYVSANADTTYSNPQNKVSLINLSSGAMTTVLNTADVSGPLAFDAEGSLYYGVSGIYGGDANGIGIYRYTAADLARAPLSLVPSSNPGSNNLLFANSSNGYLAYGGGSMLFQDDGANILTSYDTAALTSEIIATTPETMGFLDQEGGILYASVTDYSGGESAVFAITPEPSSPLLLALGVLVLPRRRK